MSDILLSMTGYGEASLVICNNEWRCVVQSVNSRYLDCRCRIPHNLQSLEPLIRERVKKYVERGKVDIVLTYDSVNEIATSNLFNIPWVAGFCRAGEDLVNTLDWPKNEYIYSAIIQSAFTRREAFAASTDDTDDIVDPILDLIEQALDSHFKSRSKEGFHLASDFLFRVSQLTDMMAEIERLAVGMPMIFKERIEQRLSLLLGEGQVSLDESRLCQEVAYLVDKADITEEIVRFRAHIAQFVDDVESKLNKRKGKKLDFIVQEMLREINTIGSKANLLEITKNVVDIKNELERIREQVQNVI